MKCHVNDGGKVAKLIGLIFGWLCILALTLGILIQGGLSFQHQKQLIDASNGQEGNCTVVNVYVSPYCVTYTCGSEYRYNLTFASNGRNISELIPFGTENLDPFVLVPGDIIPCWSSDFNNSNNLVVAYQTFSQNWNSLSALVVGFVICFLLLLVPCSGYVIYVIRKEGVGLEYQSL